MKRYEINIPTNCFIQGCYNDAFTKAIMHAKNVCYKYNKISPLNNKKRQKMIKKLFGKVGKNCIITPPFWCDYGSKIEMGDYFYSNHNMTILDGGGVKFGNNVFVAPNCVFTTAEHAIDPQMRKDGIEIAKPIVIGNNVWIGSGVTVLAGATIGDNSVIGAGSVVCGDIPSNVVAVGVPCKVKRNITEADKKSHKMYEGKY